MADQDEKERRIFDDVVSSSVDDVVNEMQEGVELEETQVEEVIQEKDDEKSEETVEAFQAEAEGSEGDKRVSAL